MEYSDRGKPNDYYVNRISEEEFESERERRSSPPGTIGDAQDIMSENIESSLKLLRRKHGHVIQNQTAISGAKLVRERIPLPNENKHVMSFKKVYDRLFKDFKDKLVQEYALMKNSYMQEYELNF